MRTSCLYVVGDEVKATFTPIGERADSASAVSVKKKSTYNDYISAKIPQVFLVTITAPAESTVSAGIFSDYYIYDFVEPTVTEDANGVAAVFRMPEITSSGVQGANHFYRVQNPDGVTYWNFAKWTAEVLGLTFAVYGLNDIVPSQTRKTNAPEKGSANNVTACVLQTFN
jgi:hypothetical protein